VGKYEEKRRLGKSSCNGGILKWILKEHHYGDCTGLTRIRSGARGVHL